MLVARIQRRAPQHPVQPAEVVLTLPAGLVGGQAPVGEDGAQRPGQENHWGRLGLDHAGPARNLGLAVFAAVVGPIPLHAVSLFAALSRSPLRRLCARFEHWNLIRPGRSEAAQLVWVRNGGRTPMRTIAGPS